MIIEMADVLNYLMTIIGGLIVYILNGVKLEIRDIKRSIEGLEREVRDQILDLEKRMTTMETKCSMFHSRDIDHVDHS